MSFFATLLALRMFDRLRQRIAQITLVLLAAFSFGCMADQAWRDYRPLPSAKKAGTFTGEFVTQIVATDNARLRIPFVLRKDMGLPYRVVTRVSLKTPFESYRIEHMDVTIEGRTSEVVLPSEKLTAVTTQPGQSNSWYASAECRPIRNLRFGASRSCEPPDPRGSDCPKTEPLADAAQAGEEVPL